MASPHLVTLKIQKGGSLGVGNPAASSIGRELEVFTAKTNHEINAAFVSLVQKRADALFINGDGFFTNRVVQLATLAVHHRVPAIYSLRDFVMAGGLISYGASFADMVRQVGIYAGRVLKGEKPADLPVLPPGNVVKRCPIFRLDFFFT